MILGQKNLASHILGKKIGHNHTIGSKLTSLVVKKIAHDISQYQDKKDENPKSFLEKR